MNDNVVEVGIIEASEIIGRAVNVHLLIVKSV